MTDLTKEELIQTLQRMGVPNTVLLEDPSVTLDTFVLAIKKFRIAAPDDFYAYLADRLGLAFMERETLFANRGLVQFFRMRSVRRH
jgi:hypothetical protein